MQAEMNMHMNTNSSRNQEAIAIADEKNQPRTQPDEKCPRCDSWNTKFCYYNNYCMSQPRYFCKACRRYWTKGGSLRSVPVGGGSRKNRRIRALHQIENVNNNNNVVLNSATFDPKSIRTSLSLADHPNFSSPFRYDDSGTCDSLYNAIAALQRQSNVHHFGYEFGTQNSILSHQPITSSFKGLYNYGFENGGEFRIGHQTQPLPAGNEGCYAVKDGARSGEVEQQQQWSSGSRIMLE